VKRGRSLAAFVLVLVVCVGCDHASKRVASELLADGAPVAFAGDAVRFQLTENRGAFLELGAGLPEPLRSALFSGLVPLLLIAVLFIGRRGQASFAERIALGMVVGGGLANWLDRLQHAGAVTDFVSVGVGPLRTGIFNAADVALMAGLAILMLQRSRA